MSDNLVKRLRNPAFGTETTERTLMNTAADRIEELEAENKLLNEQMAAIEEHGNEMLNALPDCLMRLAVALVENDELEAKLAKAVEALDWMKYGGGPKGESAHMKACETLAELKGEKDE
jgi:hypothetical protein